MKDELGNKVSEESLRVYRSFMRPPARWPWVFASLVVAALMAYALTLAHDAWNAYLCHDSEGSWSRGNCVPPTIEVKHYTITVPPRDPEPAPGDIPPPPPPPKDDGQRL